MSDINCQACTELRDYAPGFIQNGVTGKTALSLSKDTGLNPDLTVLHNNCEDLTDANDCLVGRMGQEVQAYDQCDWKDYMSRLVPNLYELNKAMIAGDCGQWRQIHALCDQLSQTIAMPMGIYGILNGSVLEPAADHWGGEIPEKGGFPACRWRYTEHHPDDDYDSLGINYTKLNTFDCDGNPAIYEWVYPQIHCYYLAPNIEYDDVIWRVRVTKLREWGVTDEFVRIFTQYPQWWSGVSNSRGQLNYLAFWMGIEGEWLNLKLIGSIGDPKNQYIDYVPRTPYIVFS